MNNGYLEQLTSLLLALKNDAEDPVIIFAFNDRSIFKFTINNAEKFYQELFNKTNNPSTTNNPKYISTLMKKSFIFHKCGFCTGLEQGICNGLKPYLPLIPLFEKHSSNEKIIFAKKEKDKYLILDNIPLSSVLKYIALDSITHYCNATSAFSKYFSGITADMELSEISKRIYLNIYWSSRGDLTFTNQEVTRIAEILLRSTQNRLEKLKLLTKSNAFADAFIYLTLPLQLLNNTLEDIME
ncbi:MAG: hypothetical protein HQK53_04805 [Oligoflexia bacterium]|nr:hypothetical protein [Oligoflexia bacterium]